MVHIQLDELKKYAEENNIPIMQKDGIDFLTKYIKENNIKNILEIGSAIGYSAIKMALVDDDIKITTIERDIERYNVAVKNINDFNLSDRINIILGDALDTNIEDLYDLIKKSWNEETSNEETYGMSSKSTGQCDVTALLIKELPSNTS